MTISKTRLIVGGTVAVVATAASAEIDAGLKLPEVDEHATVGGMPLKFTSGEAPKAIGKVKEIAQGSTKEDARKLNTMAANFVSYSAS